MQNGTLKALYAEVTGDKTTHQRTIDAHFRKLAKRRQDAIRARLAGQSYAEIGTTLGHISAASAREIILRALEAIRKQAHQEPRFNHIGRKHAHQDW